MKFGFLGVGNMASAIVRAIIGCGFIQGSQVFVYDKSHEATERLSNEANVVCTGSYEELISNSDYLLTGLKPNVCLSVLPQISSIINQYKPVIISIAAGITIEKLTELTNGGELSIVRTMPNINALVHESVTAVCKNSNVSDLQFGVILDVLKAIGSPVELEEEYFPVFTAIASCSPAFTYMYIDSLARGAQKLGMNKKKALEIAALAVSGSTKMLLQSDSHPYELIDSVCSPGGSTIEGVCTLSEKGFDAALVAAVEACVKKDVKK